MQNPPDKGVSGSAYYLKADYIVTGLTDGMCESQGGNEGDRKAFPMLGPSFYERSDQARPGNQPELPSSLSRFMNGRMLLDSSRTHWAPGIASRA